MRLWTDEIEAARPEAREVVSAGMEVVRAFLDDGTEPPTDPVERVRHMRSLMSQTYQPHEAAVERPIAGVRCKVIDAPAEPRAIYLHFHGGGMIMGGPEMNETGNAALAEALGLTVVSVDYRKAPEHPFPAGPDDGIAVAAWLLEHGVDTFGTDRLVLGGESAGGYMTAAVLLRLRDELDALDRVAGASIVFGVLDWGGNPSQHGRRVTDAPDMLDPDGVEFFTEAYLPGRTPEERRDPSISPAYADLGGLPPALFSVGTADHLLDDTLLMASRYAAAGNDTELFVAPDLPHGFMAFPCAITDAWNRTLLAWFERVLA